ncbi:MAG: DUF47 family protein [Bacteroidetes bacterium]|nr:DUF47 family protein [Bacteroidota bacterium]
MRNLFSDFFSHRKLFYSLFNQAAKNITDMSALLIALVSTCTARDREPLYKQINALEEIGDDISHKIYLGLDKVFFTPFNRKDIHRLTSVLDDVADNIQEAASRMHTYALEQFIPAISEIAEYVKSSCTEIQNLVSSMAKIDDPDAMLGSCRKIGDYQNQSEKAYHRALADLFATEKDPIRLIKYSDILHSLETSVSKCKNATDVIEMIILNSK